MTKFSRPFCLFNIVVLCAAAAICVPARAQDTANTATPAPVCSAPDDVTRLTSPLTRTGKKLAAGEPLKIVAIGSSSTAGAGASAPDRSYPSVLAFELKAMFPRAPIEVINRGVNGEEAAEMLARLDAGVLEEKPDLILWQVGTNAVLRNHPIGPAGSMILDGLRRMKGAGADVILIDPQFAPKVLAKHDVDEMVDLIAIAAKTQNVDLFRRFAIMRHWRQVARIPFEAFISPDELHMNDWSYGCVGKLLAAAIAEASTRSTVTATAVPAVQAK